MSDVCLGTVPPSNQQRDAIHVAVIPMVASEMLRPGQRIGLIGTSEAGPSSNVIGIVDPFLTDVVPKGSTFYMCLLPNSVVGMRHEWQHPLFHEFSAEQSTDTEKLFADYVAKKCGKTLEALMSDATTFAEIGDWTYDNSERYKEVTDTEWARFWNYFRQTTGLGVEREWAPYTCSC